MKSAHAFVVAILVAGIALGESHPKSHCEEGRRQSAKKSEC